MTKIVQVEPGSIAEEGGICPGDYLVSVNGEKVNLLSMATDAAQKAGAHAGNLIKQAAAIVGGGGGGRPGMAQAGGKKPENADQAVEAAKSILEKMLH